MRRAVAALVALAACGQESIETSKTTTADYGADRLAQAIARFVASGRSPEAYRVLADEIERLAPGVDGEVANRAERALTGLALEPMQAALALAPARRFPTLALTMLPAALAPAIAPEEIKSAQAQRAAYQPTPDETPDAYAERLCRDVIPLTCRDVVREAQGDVLIDTAIEKLAERYAAAVGDCLTCGSGGSWDAQGAAWDELARTHNHDAGVRKRAAMPQRWPIAGDGAVELSVSDQGNVVELEPLDDATISVGGERVLRRDLVQRSRGMVVAGLRPALHLQPNADSALLVSLLQELFAAGVPEVGVLARTTSYPWPRRVYWLTAKTMLPEARLVRIDSVQLYLRTLDVLPDEARAAPDHLHR